MKLGANGSSAPTTPPGVNVVDIETMVGSSWSNGLPPVDGFSGGNMPSVFGAREETHTVPEG